MSEVAHVDFETRSAIDLKKVGLYNYARHPSTEPWVMAWAIGEEEPNVWMLGEPMPARLALHVTSGGTVAAHNSPFELEIWNEILVPRYNWRPLAPEQTVCTMAAAYAMGLPGALEDAALAMGLALTKDMEGRALILRMARPRRVESNGTVVWWDDAERVARGVEYCRQDVRVERALHQRLMPLGARERAVWLADYRINRRGIQLDVATAEAAVAMTDRVKAAADVQIAKLTNNAVTAVGALAAMKLWLKEQAPGHDFSSLAKDTVADLLDGKALVEVPDPTGFYSGTKYQKAPVLPEPARKLLEIRQEVGKASIAKLDVMLAIAGDDGRMRGTVQYHGATTGRWAGRKIQPHNFPRDIPEQDTVEQIFKMIRQGEDEAIDMIYGPPLSVVSLCLRGFLTVAPGNVLVGADFSAIEGRGTAWFSGEQWKLDAFRAFDEGKGPDIYKLTASKILKIPVDQITKQQRQRPGKTAELAFGYQGGVGAARKFGATEPEAIVDGWKDDWRAAHPNIVRTWKQLDNAGKLAVQNPGQVFMAGAPGRQCRFKVVGSFLWCLLPSGRALCYPYPKMSPGIYGDVVSFMTQPGPDDFKKGKIIPDPNNTPKWARVGIYGGAWMENIVQAICRDLLVDCVILPFQDSVVLHVHDDGNLEVPEKDALSAKLALTLAMNNPPEWAAGFPLFAEVNIMKRYGK